MDNDEMKQIIGNIKQGLRVTKVVATRSVKTGRGDFFAGVSAGWKTVQDDAGGPGADMELTMTDAEQVQQGMTLKEARIARYIVAMEADIGAYEAAYANGAISQSKKNEAIKVVKNNYGLLIREVLMGE